MGADKPHQSRLCPTCSDARSVIGNTAQQSEEVHQFDRRSCQALISFAMETNEINFGTSLGRFALCTELSLGMHEN